MSQIELASCTWQWVQCSLVAFSVIGSESSRSWDVIEREQESAPEKSVGLAWCNHVNRDQSIKGLFPTSCGICGMKDLEIKSRPYPVLLEWKNVSFTDCIIYSHSFITVLKFFIKQIKSLLNFFKSIFFTIQNILYLWKSKKPIKNYVYLWSF